MRITAEMIEETKDKWWWISAMRRKWPDGMEVTPENLHLVVGMGANLRWWAEDLFRPAALAAYRAATTDAGEKEDKAVEESYVAFHAVTDGPYTEGKEVVGGFFIIKAKDMNEAVAISISLFVTKLFILTQL